MSIPECATCYEEQMGVCTHCNKPWCDDCGQICTDCKQPVCSDCWELHEDAYCETECHVCGAIEVVSRVKRLGGVIVCGWCYEVATDPAMARATVRYGEAV